MISMQGYKGRILEMNYSGLYIQLWGWGFEVLSLGFRLGIRASLCFLNYHRSFGFRMLGT